MHSTINILKSLNVYKWKLNCTLAYTFRKTEFIVFKLYISFRKILGFRMNLFKEVQILILPNCSHVTLHKLNNLSFKKMTVVYLVGFFLWNCFQFKEIIWNWGQYLITLKIRHQETRMCHPKIHLFRYWLFWAGYFEKLQTQEQICKAAPLEGKFLSTKEIFINEGLY